MRKLFAVLFASAFVLGGIMFTACDSGGGSFYQEKIINPASGKSAANISLVASRTDISVAESEAAVGVSFVPGDARVVVWTDSDAIAFSGEPEKVGDSWVIRFKPKRVGAFSVYAQSGGVKESLMLKVSARAVSVAISGYAAPIEKGATVKLSAQTNPASTTSTIKWASADPDVATVDQNGLVTAVSAGEARITATAVDTAFAPGGLTPVTGFVDVTVKGFYLNENYFILCQKDVDDKVEANIVGLDGGTIAWSSNDTNKFTVEDVSADTKSAKLKYKNGAFGEAQLTATLTASSGTYTAKATVFVVPYFMLALGDSIAAGYSPRPMGGKAKDEGMAEQDMIDAYEKYINRRKGGTDPNYVNEFCYSAKLREYIAGSRNIKLQSYANTGDQTKDLIEKLKAGYSDGTIATKKGEILEALSQADYITLCIGANDILQRATGMNILLRDLDWFRSTFTQDLADFKTRFDSILSTLVSPPMGGASPRIYVMSVYSPYHHFTEARIPASQFTPPCDTIIKKIIAINGIAEGFLNLMNDYIKSKADADSNVFFVDVAREINNVADVAEHAKLIHADPTKFDLEALVSAMGQTVPIWFDPHPTKAGAEKIKDEFAKQTYPTYP